MKKITILTLILFFTLNNTAARIDRDEFVIESHLFMGTKSTGISGPEVTVSSSVQPFNLLLNKDILEDERNDIVSLQEELGTIYKLKHVEHLATVNMFWDGRAKNLNNVIFLDGEAVPINISPKLISADDIKLHIEIFKLREEKSLRKGLILKAKTSRRFQDSIHESSYSSSGDINLLDMEIILRIDRPVILGFPSNGNTYFLSIIVSKEKSKAFFGGKFQGDFDEVNIFKPPEPVYQVIPEYPQECHEKKIEGKVILEVSTDTKGNVVELRVVKPVHPRLDLAALRALKQWKFTPIKKDRKPVPVVFNVIVDFRWRENRPLKQEDSREEQDTELKRILDGCASYCKRLTESALYFVCKETIKEKIYKYRKPSKRRDSINSGEISVTVWAFERRPPRIIKNVYVYDYQLIKKGGDIQESRTLLQENGKQKNEKSATLKTRRFYSEKSAFGPVGLLSDLWQKLYDYKLIKSTKISDHEAFIIEAKPKESIPGKPNHGKIWIDKEDFSILRIDIEMESLPGFKVIEEASKKKGLRPYITVSHYYMIEKNGVRFPSKTTFKEKYGDLGGKKFKQSELEIIYEKYRFFTVETEVIY